MIDGSKILFFDNAKVLLYRNGSDQIEAAFYANGRISKSIPVHEEVRQFDAFASADKFFAVFLLGDGTFLCSKHNADTRCSLIKRNLIRGDGKEILSFLLLRSGENADLLVTRLVGSKCECIRYIGILNDDPAVEVIFSVGEKCCIEYGTAQPFALFVSSGNAVYTLSRSTMGKYTPLIKAAQLSGEIYSFTPYVSGGKRHYTALCSDGLYVDGKLIADDASYPVPDGSGSVKYLSRGTVCKWCDGHTETLRSSAGIARYRTDRFPGLMLCDPFPDSALENEAPPVTIKSVPPDKDYDREIFLLKSQLKQCCEMIAEMKKEINELKKIK